MMYQTTEVGQTLAGYDGTPAKITLSVRAQGWSNTDTHASLTLEEALELQAQLARAIAEFDPKKRSWI